MHREFQGEAEGDCQNPEVCICLCPVPQPTGSHELRSTYVSGQMMVGALRMAWGCQRWEGTHPGQTIDFYSGRWASVLGDIYLASVPRR